MHPHLSSVLAADRSARFEATARRARLARAAQAARLSPDVSPPSPSRTQARGEPRPVGALKLTARDRLLLVFANLASYGIAARPALAATRRDGGPLLAGELHVRHPHGVGSYVFWTAADDASFGSDGELPGDLELHCSDAATREAVDAACQQGGIATRRDGLYSLIIEAVSAASVRSLRGANDAYSC